MLEQLSNIDFNIDHPDGLFCPICGCGEIYWWPELEDWNTWTDEQKKSYENCPSCGYPNEDEDD